MGDDRRSRGEAVDLDGHGLKELGGAIKRIVAEGLAVLGRAVPQLTSSRNNEEEEEEGDERVVFTKSSTQSGKGWR